MVRHIIDCELCSGDDEDIRRSVFDESLPRGTGGLHHNHALGGVACLPRTRDGPTLTCPPRVSMLARPKSARTRGAAGLPAGVHRGAGRVDPRQRVAGRDAQDTPRGPSLLSHL
jgi:hypothetical protein